MSRGSQHYFTYDIYRVSDISPRLSDFRVTNGQLVSTTTTTTTTSIYHHHVPTCGTTNRAFVFAFMYSQTGGVDCFCLSFGFSFFLSSSSQLFSPFSLARLRRLLYLLTWQGRFHPPPRVSLFFVVFVTYMIKLEVENDIQLAYGTKRS